MSKQDDIQTASAPADSLHSVVLPPGFDEIIREVEANENYMVELGKKLGIDMAVSDDPEKQKLWVMQRAWGKWAMQQKGEELQCLCYALSEMYQPRTKNWALLREAAQRLKNTKPRKIKVRQNK